MSSKILPQVLIFIDWFLPGYKAGGPIQSVVNLIKHLGNEFQFYVVTSNKDLGESDPYPNIEFNSWIIKENYQIIYLDDRHQKLKKYKELLQAKDFDAIYFNSLFSLNFTLKPLLLTRASRTKIILAPRGMLGIGALRIKKRKKQLYLKLFKFIGLNNNIIWHATTISEASEIKRHFGENGNVRTATNLSAVMLGNLGHKIKYINQLNIFFLSRISKKKNLGAALEFLYKVKSECKIRFNIIGPIEDVVYWNECRRIIGEMPLNIQVNYLGAVPNYELKQHLKDQHFMLLPTHHENFGHVIMESWQNACPVIISDKTPWEDLKQKNIGFDIPLEEVENFVNAIEKAAGMDQTEYDRWSKAAFDFAQEYCNNPKAVEASRNLFL
jgi:glycosyltransferase involved in cell wall biosynthesis